MKQSLLLLCLMAVQAHAQIIYTDVIPDAGYGVNGDTCFLDLDNNGIPDQHIIYYRQPGAGCPCGTGPMPHASWVKVHGVGSNAAGNMAAQLAPLTIIGPSMAWSTNGTLSSLSTHCVMEMVLTCEAYNVIGPWSSGISADSARYLGLRFTSNGSTHYGWAHLRISANPYVVPGFTLQEYAYNSVPDAPILAGDAGTCAPLVRPKLMLDGPYDPTTGLMSDALRSAGLVPLTEPYTSAGYMFTAGGGGEATTAAILAVTGANAIVDWVVVELRTAASPTVRVATHAALLQRDGDVVGTDGTSAISFNVPCGNYLVVVRHRNHLGVMTLNAVALNNSATTVNFTTAATATYGTGARKSITGTFPTQALWSGDVTFNGDVAYTGTNNDRDVILLKVGSTTPNNTVAGYWREDVNLSGLVKYTGTANDRDPILVNTGSTTPNNVRMQQLP